MRALKGILQYDLNLSASNGQPRDVSLCLSGAEPVPTSPSPMPILAAPLWKCILKETLTLPEATRGGSLAWKAVEG